MPETQDTTLEKGPQREATEKAAQAQNAREELSPQERSDATAWFLQGSPEGPARCHFEINVSADSRKTEWLKWSVRAMDRDRIAEIRSNAADADDNVGRAGMSANLRIAAEATTDPNLKELRGQYADPADALAARFSFKPGLIDHIAQKVLKATGYDDEDVREVDAVKN